MTITDSWHRDLGSPNLSPWHDGSSSVRNRFVATIRGDLRFCEFRHYLEFGLGGHTSMRSKQRSSEFTECVLFFIFEGSGDVVNV